VALEERDLDTAPHSRFSEREYRELADFRCALRRLLRVSEEEAIDAGITPQQYVLLVVVRGHSSYPAVTMGEVVEALQLRQSSGSLLVERSVKRGLVRREPDLTDRRRVIVSLTDQGLRILDAIMRAELCISTTSEDARFWESVQKTVSRLERIGLAPQE
jgi:DNA-binding MarR family transcriptional regulator